MGSRAICIDEHLNACACTNKMADMKKYILFQKWACSSANHLSFHDDVSCGMHNMNSNTVNVSCQESTDFIKSKLDGLTAIPTIGLVCGSNLSSIEFDHVHCSVPFDSVPHFCTSSVKGHSSKLVVGQIKGKTVIVLFGIILLSKMFR